MTSGAFMVLFLLFDINSRFDVQTLCTRHHLQQIVAAGRMVIGIELLSNVCARYEKFG
jgi:hypothetical protein